MSFFPLYTSDRTFTPLFRLLDDFESYSRESQGSASNRHQQLRSFNPKFDVRETEAAYELHGELAGVKRDDVQIEFTDPQTLVVRGKIERTYTAGTPPAALSDASTPAEGSIAAASDDVPAAPVSHKATVEDELDESATEKSTPVATPETVAAQPAEKQVKPKVPAERYWVSERSIGQFSRPFHFPIRVDQDAVTAQLNNGILTVVVPKAKKHEARRININ